MAESQMRERCPNAKRVGKAAFPDHRLAFPRFSTNRQCGVSSLVPATGETAWGVLFELDAEDLRSLDKHEGYRAGRSPAQNSYERREATVLRDGDPSAPVCAWTYFANPQPGVHVPSAAYLKLIIDGARDAGLPQAYIAKLLQVEPMK
ncbi:MAG: hypothetical protein QOE90_3517 [Thermoplasmata archaeon]|jgi:gamma-glutamylcyclotransferase (GGCT)/AIG2-like uncharacterized protein YtfP|nr:hypothetical protein [Thermoplasmata archaeon]